MAEMCREPPGRPDREPRTSHPWTTQSADSRTPAPGSGQAGPSLQAPRKPRLGVDSESTETTLGLHSAGPAGDMLDKPLLLKVTLQPP